MVSNTSRRREGSNASLRSFLSHRQGRSPSVQRSLGGSRNLNSRESSVVSNTSWRREGSVLSDRREERAEDQGEQLGEWRIGQTSRRARERSSTVERSTRRVENVPAGSSSSSNSSSSSPRSSPANREPARIEIPADRVSPSDDSDGPSREPSLHNRHSCRTPVRRPSNRPNRPSGPSRRRTPAPRRRAAPAPRRNAAKVLRDIRRLQSSTDLLIPKLPFQRLIRETAYRVTGAQDLRFQGFGLKALQEATEAYLIQMFEMAYLCALHAKRVTLRPNDMILVQRILSMVGLT